MRKALAIFKKELAIYFTTPQVYIFSSLMLCVCSVWFWFANIERLGEASLRYVIQFMVNALLLLAPIVTMRLIAEERKSGTVELLLTSPVREWQIIAGKYAAAMTVFAAFFAVTLVYPIVLIWKGSPGPDVGVLAAQYLGLFLTAAAAAAIGLFFSAITSSQFIAVLLGILAMVSLFMLRVLGELTGGEGGRWIRSATFAEHLDNFSKGVVDGVDIYYFLGVAAFFLFLAMRALEARRWARQ